MASADTSGGGGGGDASPCARDFIEYRLQEADSPMSPAELADEYGCTNGHIRNMLTDMLDDGVVERVGRGQYVAVVGDMSAEGAEVDAEVHPDTSASTGVPADADADADDALPSPDGEAPSEGTDTEAQDDREGEIAEIEDDEMADLSELADDGDGEPDSDDVAGAGDGEEGVVQSIAPGKKLVGATLLFLVGAVVLAAENGSSGSEDQETEESNEDDEQTDVPLIGGD